MLILRSEITVGEYTFKFVNECVIESSWQDFTSTCEITLPRRLQFESEELARGANAVFTRGQSVEVKAGYDDDLQTIFKGKITDVDPNLPVVLKCEDGMWDLKRYSITKSYKSVDLRTLIKDIVPSGWIEGREYVVGLDAELGKYIVNKARPTQVFEDLRSRYGIFSYFVDGVLYVGTAYTPDDKALEGAKSEEHIFNMTQNVIEQDLTYTNADDTLIKVVASTIDANNVKTTIEVGDAEGQTNNLTIPNITVDELRKHANRFLERLKIDGWVGNFTTFLQPRVKHGDVVELIDSQVPDRNGKYYVKRVTTSFGMGGGRQTIELDKNA